ncbi:MAG: hypothetical protein MMC23_006187 [Stictis urceolatum]|nr:hypothetical protein [Stictis urceolata]
MADSNGQSLAILDDYLSLGPSHFSPMPNLPTTSIPATISSYPSPSTLSEQVSRLRPYTIISSMRERTPFPASLLSQLPHLRLLLTTGTRNASIDMSAASSHGITVTGTTGAGRSDAPEDASAPAPPKGFDSTSQHAWSLILALASRLPDDDRLLKSDGAVWQTGTSVLLAGKIFGAVGLGRLGARAAATAALGFGMRVVAWSENLTQAKADEAARRFGLSEGTFRVVGKKEVFEANVVSLHYVLSNRSRGLVGTEELGWMKKGAMFVNTARAGLVDQEALLEVCREGRIRGAALDVFWEEPLGKESSWRREEWGKGGRAMVVLSPHMGYMEKDVMRNWYAEQAEEVERFLGGKEPKFRLN